MNPRLIIPPGTVYGRWTVLADVPVPHKAPRILLCRCQCGTERPVAMGNLRNGASFSCGCYNLEQSKTHGLYEHPLYHIWFNMKDRCEKSQHQAYANYGGRGIKVCERWNDIATFIADMYPTYRARLQLDRIDNDLGYSPENCCWSTPQDNASNKRTNVFVLLNGERMTINQAVRKTGVSKQSIKRWAISGASTLDLKLAPV
jgi:hypothetical protein